MSNAILIFMHLVIGSSTFMYVIHRGYYMAARRYEISLRVLIFRLQNSPYFCVFRYARAVKQKVWNEAENSRACEARALRRARKTLTPRFTDFFTDFEKKNRLFCSL